MIYNPCSQRSRPDSSRTLRMCANLVSDVACALRAHQSPFAPIAKDMETYMRQARARASNATAKRQRPSENREEPIGMFQPDPASHLQRRWKSNHTK